MPVGIWTQECLSLLSRFPYPSCCMQRSAMVEDLSVLKAHGIWQPQGVEISTHQRHLVALRCVILFQIPTFYPNNSFL